MDEKNSCDSLVIQLSAELQLSLSDLVQLPGAKLWNESWPSADGSFGNAESGGYSGASFEMSDYVVFEHVGRLDMLNANCKDAEPAAGYPVVMETMGDRIRLLRLAKSLTQEQLGERVGVSKVSVSQWETGSTANIRLKTFLTLCEELGTSPQYLIFGPGRPGNPPGPARRRAAQ